MMYKTYQEAKINCPEACVCLDKTSGMFFVMPSREGTTLSDDCEFAEPKDHCMSVKEFLDAGYRFEVGDFWLDYDGEVMSVKGLGIENVNRPHELDGERYILRAAALESRPLKQYAVLYKGGSYSFQSDKPVGDDIVACFDLSHSEAPLVGDFFEEKPRTKVEYVKSDIESRGKALDTFDNDVELFELVDGEYKQVTTESDAISKWRNLYERIETPMTEREAFIEEAMSNFFNKSGVTHEIVAEMFDSGKFRLVN